MDRELEHNKQLTALLQMLKSVLARFAMTVRDEASVEELTLAMIGAWDKHRSRWLIKQLERWLDDKYPLQTSWLRVEHLSEHSRKEELQHCQ